MKIGIFGSGKVARSLGRKMIDVGNEVMLGSRSRSNALASKWVKENVPGAFHGSFADAASFGTALFNCTSAAGTMDALKSAGRENMAGKILVDLSNPLGFRGPVSGSGAELLGDSLAERIQREFPEVRVVKTLNTVGYRLMVEPSLLAGEQDMFISGNDAAAKSDVIQWLKKWFGWKSVIDLGDLSGARSQETLLLFLVKLTERFNTSNLGIRIVTR